MKKNFFIMTLALMAMFVISCTNDDLVENVDDIRIESPSHRLTAEQAGQNALDFVKKFKTETRAGQSGLKITDIKAVGINPERTRSTNESIDFDSLFYVVNFADNQGFVIAAADDRDESVFAYVEEGEYNEEDTLNNGFNVFMDALYSLQTSRGIQRFDTQEDFIYFDPDEGGDSSYPDKFEVMSPLLVTKWGQSAFYSSLCPGQYSGCVPTAISQICSFLKVPSHVSWSYDGISYQSSINWDGIIYECLNNPWFQGEVYSSGLEDQIAHLMRFWGVEFNANYGLNGTGVNSNIVIPKLWDNDIDATILRNYNSEDVIEDLKEGNNIVYMCGNDGISNTGHAWVVDGYIHRKKNSRDYFYLHCNWGWSGGQNGYFLGSVLNAGEGPVYNDDGQKTRSSQEPTYNYTNNLRFSTISR